MKIIFLLTFLLLLHNDCKSQIIIKDTITKKIIFGLHSAGSGYNTKDWVTGKKTYFRAIYVEPYIGYFFNRNFGVGIIGGHESIRSNIDSVINQNYFEIGGFARYYYPLRFNSKKLKIFNSTLFLSEISYKLTTYQKISSTKFEIANKLDYTLLTIIPFGFQFRLWRGLHFEISPEYWLFSNKYTELRYRIGFEYQINKNDKNK
jgi:hypothetical protein